MSVKKPSLEQTKEFPYKALNPVTQKEEVIENEIEIPELNLVGTYDLGQLVKQDDGYTIFNLYDNSVFNLSYIFHKASFFIFNY